jgi:hypothetical protein
LPSFSPLTARGEVAVLGDRVFFTTTDAHMIASTE